MRPTLVPTAARATKSHQALSVTVQPAGRDRPVPKVRAQHCVKIHFPFCACVLYLLGLDSDLRFVRYGPHSQSPRSIMASTWPSFVVLDSIHVLSVTWLKALIHQKRVAVTMYSSSIVVSNTDVVSQTWAFYGSPPISGPFTVPVRPTWGQSQNKT